METLQEKTFEKAQVGDKVYSLRYGEGKVMKITDFIIQIKFTQSAYRNLEYYTDGRTNNNDVTPDLYWSKPEIIAPEAPRRLVEKTIIKYCNIYLDANNKITNGLLTFTDRGSAIAQASKAHNIIATGAEVTIKFQIEE